jgi:hypothetical protein
VFYCQVVTQINCTLWQCWPQSVLSLLLHSALESQLGQLWGDPLSFSGSGFFGFWIVCNSMRLSGQRFLFVYACNTRSFDIPDQIRTNHCVTAACCTALGRSMSYGHCALPHGLQLDIAHAFLCDRRCCDNLQGTPTAFGLMTLYHRLDC